MRKRFVIALGSTTKEQNDAFREYLNKIAPGRWWHWIQDLWLIVDPNGELNATSLREKASEYYPAVTCLVLEIGHDDDTWAGFGPAASGKSMFPWLEKHWDR